MNEKKTNKKKTSVAFHTVCLLSALNSHTCVIAKLCQNLIILEAECRKGQNNIIH